MRPICNGMRPICNGMRTIDVIRKAKDIYVSGKEKCMCLAFYDAINTDWAYEREYIKENIPLFCYSVAVGVFGANGVEDGYWWDINDRDERIRYFDWLIERYRDPVSVDRDPVWGEYYPVI